MTLCLTVPERTVGVGRLLAGRCLSRESTWWGMRLGREARLGLVGLCKPWGGLELHLERENLGSPLKKIRPHRQS